MRDRQDWAQMRESIIGLGTESSRRTYYPELQNRISQLEEAREGLRRSEANLRTLFDSLHDAVLIHDWEGQLLEVNDAMLSMYGVTRETFRDFNLADYSASPEASQTNKVTIAVQHARLRMEGSLVFEWRARRPLVPDGDFDVEVSLRRATWYDQDVVVAVVRDVSERKRLEAMLQQSQKLDALGQLAGGVAHDTNNMLGVIIGYADLLLEELHEGTKVHEDLQQIRKAALRSADLNRQLLGFARKQTIQPVPADLNLLVEATQKMLRRLIGEQHTLVWKPATDLWQVCVDPSQMDQILTNLVLNARDALGASGSITLETANVTVDEAFHQVHPDADPGQFVVLRVTDTGHGMSPEIQARIFEPFFTTKQLGRGTGLGLAMVYGIARQNRGFVSVYSSRGLGTTFSFYLPRLQGGDPAAVPVPDPDPRGGWETLLLVEDELTLLELGTRVLEGAGYQVIPVSDPMEALGKVRDGLQSALLVTDLIMPGLNGIELFHQIHALSPAIRVLFVSGYPSGTLDFESQSGYGRAFLQKPFTRAALLHKVREILDA
jgi:PAS domain S-box-containing protein